VSQCPGSVGRGGGGERGSSAANRGRQSPKGSKMGGKLKVKAKFTLDQATKAKRGSRGIALLFL